MFKYIIPIIILVTILFSYENKIKLSTVKYINEDTVLITNENNKTIKMFNIDREFVDSWIKYCKTNHIDVIVKNQNNKK